MGTKMAKKEKNMKGNVMIDGETILRECDSSIATGV